MKPEEAAEALMETRLVIFTTQVGRHYLGYLSRPDNGGRFWFNGREIKNACLEGEMISCWVEPREISLGISEIRDIQGGTLTNE